MSAFRSCLTTNTCFPFYLDGLLGLNGSGPDRLLSGNHRMHLLIVTFPWCLSWHHCTHSTQVGLNRQDGHHSPCVFFLAWLVSPYTCIIMSHKQRKHESAGGTNSVQRNGSRFEWKDPSKWHCHLTSIKANNKQFLNTAGSNVFIYTAAGMCIWSIHAAKEVSIRKPQRLQKYPSHCAVLES